MIQCTLSLKMATRQVVKTSVTVNNRPTQDYDQPPTYEISVQTIDCSTTVNLYCTVNSLFMDTYTRMDIFKRQTLSGGPFLPFQSLLL